MTSYRNSRHRTLSDSHRRTLEVGSAISREVLEENGVRTITHGRELPKGFSGRQRKRAPGILFTVTRPNGKAEWIYRPQTADPERPGLKYEARCKALGSPGNVLAIPAGQRHLVNDVSVPVIFVEGLKKMLSIVSAARRDGAVVLVVGISGVWNWMSDGRPIADMFDIPVEGRKVCICFDSDMFPNPDVSDAARRLAGHLIGRGAVVYLCYLPDQADGSKTGADDFLAGGHGFWELMALMRLYNPRDLQAERLKRSERLRLMLQDLGRSFWAAEFKGIGGHSARDVFKVLGDLALARGKLHEDGLRVKVSRAELARLAKVSTRTLQKAIERLEEMGLIYRDNDNRKQRERGAFVLRAKVNRYRERLANTRETADAETDSTLSSLQLRAPRLRWPRPKYAPRRGLVSGTRKVRQSPKQESRDLIERIGKIRGAIIDALDAAGGTLTLQQVAETLHRSRPRDIRRRNLPMLEDAGIIEVDGDTVSLTVNWLEALEVQRLIGKEIEAEELAERRNEIKSRAFHRRHEIPKSEPSQAGLEAVKRSREQRQAGLAAIAERAAAAGKTEELRKAEAFVRDRLRELGRIRLALLQDIWHDEGGDPWTIPQAVEAMGCCVEELPEFGNRKFVFPPAEGAA
jgi:DNA-binding MarR family transcriptional regulator